MDLFAETSNNILVMGVGSTGLRVACMGAIDAAAAADTGECLSSAWSVAHTDPTELIATGLDRKLLLDIADGPFAFQCAERSLGKHADDLAALASGHTVVILVGALGDPHASMLLPILAGAFRKHNHFVCVIGSDPFQFEGQIRADCAAVAASRIQSESDLFLRLSTKSFIESGVTKDMGVSSTHIINKGLSYTGLSEDSPLAAFYTASDRMLYSATQCTIGILDGGMDGSGLSHKAIVQALCGTHPICVGMGTAKGVNAPVSALEIALENIQINQSELEHCAMRAGDPDVNHAAKLRTSGSTGLISNIAPCETASRWDDSHGATQLSQTTRNIVAVLLAGQELSLREVETMNAAVHAIFPVRPVVLRQRLRPLLQDEAICMLLIRFAGSRNIIPIESAAATLQ